jgi:hypothetical protein
MRLIFSVGLPESNLARYSNEAHWFLVTLTKLRKAIISFVMSVRPSVRLSVWNNSKLGSHWADFHEILYLSIFRRSVEKVKVLLKSDKHKCTLHEDVCTFVVVSRWILLRTINVSDRCFRENQNTHFTLNNFFTKIVLFFTIMWTRMVGPDSRDHFRMLFSWGDRECTSV